MIDPIKFDLSRPLDVPLLGRAISEIELREPRGADLVQAGYPLKMLSDGGSEVDADKMTKLIARLANLPDDAIHALPACDWQTAMLVTMGFFAPPVIPPASSADISSSPATGAISVTS